MEGREWWIEKKLRMVLCLGGVAKKGRGEGEGWHTCGHEIENPPSSTIEKK